MHSYRKISRLGFGILATALSAVCQTKAAPVQRSAFASVTATPQFGVAGTITRLSPNFALATYERAAEEQSTELTGYTATSVIDAELPDSAQKAEFEMTRHYSAPS